MVLYRRFEIFDSDINRSVMDRILEKHDDLFKIINDRFRANNLKQRNFIKLHDCYAEISMDVDNHSISYYYYYDNTNIVTSGNTILCADTFDQYDEIMRNTVGFEDYGIFFTNIKSTKAIRLHKIFPAERITTYNYKEISIESLVELLIENDLYHPQQKVATHS